MSIQIHKNIQISSKNVYFVNPLFTAALLNAVIL